MVDHETREACRNARRVVLKFGTRVLVDSRGRPNPKRLQAIVDQVSALHAEGREVVLVSSGAVGAGLDPLGMTRRPEELSGLQMAAAVGQTRLMAMYAERFGHKGISVGQVLLNHDDLKQRTRHLNARNCILGLLKAGVIPIVNENDVVSVDEIRLGDNDVLAALVTVLVDADLLMLCSTVNGLRAPAGEGRTRRVPFLEKVTAKELEWVFGKGSALSTGGMATKLEAAKLVNRAGSLAVIADGRKNDTITRVLEGDDCGTLLGPAIQSRRVKGKRKHWIAFFHRPSGSLQVDMGAKKALQFKGRSLLAVGVQAVEGEFGAGALLRVQSEDGSLIAQGLSEFSAAELRQITGKSSEQIREILGPAVSTEVIHRDNLALFHDEETI